MDTRDKVNSSFNSDFISPRSVSDSAIKNHDLFEIMKNERNRLSSFDGKWPLEFLNINDLAKCGFFYLLFDDKVQCAYCKLILAKWEIGDVPLDQHLKFSSKCSFLSNSSNVAKSKKTVESSHFNFVSAPLLNPSKPQKAKVPKMSDIKKRLSSYKNWSVTMISVEDLAVCGLFYTGIDDVVTCFSCGISLGDWEPYDEPTAKHSKLYSNCMFLHFVISSSCLQRKKTRKPLNTFPEFITRKSSKPSFAEILKSEMVYKAKEIFPPQLVEEVVSQHLKEKGEGFSSLQHLCDKVLEYEEKKLKIRLSTSKKSEQSSVLKTSEVFTDIGSSDLKSRAFSCKICLEAELGITFQPCGHFISCDLCSQQVSKCPVCRLPIQKRIKTYLS